MSKKFNIVSDYKPAGDQPKAISEIVAGINAGLLNQTLLGVTGSGKTFAIANVIQELQRTYPRVTTLLHLLLTLTVKLPNYWLTLF